MKLLHDLRRRRVFRLAGLYIVGAWAVIEVTSVFFPAWGIPETALRYLFVAAALLFPVAIVFAWIFDITSDGIVRTRPAGPDEAVDLSLNKTDYAVLVALAAIGVLVLVGSLERVVEEAAEHPVAGAVSERLDNSIAVLPFTNLDANPDTGYFSDGVTEEILHRLSATRALHVLARTSSFAFRNSEDGPAAISAMLGVRYLLHGSIRRDQDYVRVTARLIDENGLQVWSRSFDRKLESIFVIQSEIASAVAGEIVKEIVTTGGTSAIYGTESVAAYDRYLVGKAFTHSRASNWQERAEAAFREALDIDPGYAPAWAGLSYALFVMRSYDAERWEQAIEAADKALQLQPNLADAHAMKGVLQGWVEEDLDRSEISLRRAIELDPSLSDAYNWLANILYRQGRDAEAAVVQQQGLEIDPLNAPLSFNVADNYSLQGDFDQAERLLRRLTELPEPPQAATYLLARLHFDWGRYAEALQLSFRYGNDDSDLLANCYAALGLNDSAEPYLQVLSTENPTHGATDVLLTEGRHAEAMQLIQSYVQHHDIEYEQISDGAMEQVLRAFVFAGNYEGAIDIFENLPEEFRDILVLEAPSGGQAIAFAYQELGKIEQAAGILDRVDTATGVFDSAAPFVLETRALNRVLQGDPDGAAVLLKRAIDSGWANYYAALNDPRWRDTLSSPGFARMLEPVRENLAKQRAIMEQELAHEGD